MSGHGIETLNEICKFHSSELPYTGVTDKEMLATYKTTMSYANPFTANVVADLPEEARAQFIRKTYGHLAMAIGLFVVLEAIFFQIGLDQTAFRLLALSPYSWLVVLGGFMFVSWIADRWATQGASIGKQYAGLALFTVAEAVIFLPLLAMAVAMTGDGSLLLQAAMITGALVLALSAVALTTRKDFSFLGGILKIGFIIALGLIVASFFLPISLGFWFSAVMILLASGSVLYNTSNLIHRYEPGQHVAASLALFASVALLFWYILRLLMSLRR